MGFEPAKSPWKVTLRRAVSRDPYPYDSYDVFLNSFLCLCPIFKKLCRLQYWDCLILRFFFSKNNQFKNFTHRHLSPIPCKNYKNETNRFWILHSWYDRTCLYVPLIGTLSEVRFISWDSPITWVLTKASRKSSMSSTSIPYLSIICSLKVWFQIDSDSLTN